MKSFLYALLVTVALTMVACVTINVYFPEAAAEEAADEFINGVLGEDEQENKDSVSQRNTLLYPWLIGFANQMVPAAHAQINIDINTPAIKAIQARMKQRFDSQLKPYFDSGAIGYGADGNLAIRDLAAVSIRDRNSLKALVAADNKDRDAVYREIAVANGHPEWEAEIRSTFAERWVSNSRSGWYYQNASGQWVQK